jgi:hypothetical protein
LAEKKETPHRWINTLLSQLDLADTREERVDLRPQWSRIEESRLPERIRQVVADVNGAAGYHLLEMLDYLPPQKTVLRMSFSKNHTEHVMEIEVDENGSTLVFYSAEKSPDIWERYFRNHARKANRVTFLELDLHPSEILEEDVRAWVSYVLSGFKNKFKPAPNCQPSASVGTELDINAFLDKASA